MSRSQNTLGPIIGFHGCERKTAEKVLAGRDILKSSENDHDWLGPGVYFWVDSPDRAKEWASQQKKRKGWKESAVIGALIHPGLCLNLTDYGINQSLIQAFNVLQATCEKTNTPLPTNGAPVDGVFLRRQLDCATIKILHSMRELENSPPYDTVYGVFEEGAELFPGSAFKAKTHVQIAVRATTQIIAYFRVK